MWFGSVISKIRFANCVAFSNEPRRKKVMPPTKSPAGLKGLRLFPPTISKQVKTVKSASRPTASVVL